MWSPLDSGRVGLETLGKKLLRRHSLVCATFVRIPCIVLRLLDLVAEDAALEDTIYHLGRGLNSDTANIDLDQFLKVSAMRARKGREGRSVTSRVSRPLTIRVSLSLSFFPFDPWWFLSHMSSLLRAACENVVTRAVPQTSDNQQDFARVAGS